MIKALLFDLDETLLDRTASIQVFLAHQYSRFANVLAHVPLAQYQARFLLYDEHGYVAKEIVYRRLLNEFGLALDPMLLVEDFYANGWQPALLFPGVTELLEQTRQDGYKLAIVTSGSVRTQQPKLVHGGLNGLFDQALISEAEGVRKPDAEIFLRAADRLEVQPHECVMVGDNPRADVWGALQVGMKAIWRQGHLPWPSALAQRPQRTVTSVGELLGFDWQQL
ncbi:MAG: HAD family hydrolase [Caldilineaceae bacterium]